MSVRVGFASKDGRRVDECLLASSEWWIYDIGETVYLADRRSEKISCADGCDRCQKALLQQLRDCDLLFACDCEAQTASLLFAEGKQVVVTKAGIDEMLRRVQRHSQQKVSLDYYRKVQSIVRDYAESVSA